MKMIVKVRSNEPKIEAEFVSLHECFEKFPFYDLRCECEHKIRKEIAKKGYYEFSDYEDRLYYILTIEISN